MVVAILLLAGCRFGSAGTPTQPQQSPTALATTAQETPGGIPTQGGEATEQVAVQLARPHLADPGAALSAVRHGRMDAQYGSVAGQDQPVPGDPGREVWAVEFVSTFEVCGPVGSTCETVRGFVTVFLDYSDGHWIATASYSPLPGHTLPPATE